MQSRVSARVVGSSPVECSHRNISLSFSLLSVRSFLYAAYVISWDVRLLNSCSFVGRSYWPRKRSSCDKCLSFISWIRWSVTGRLSVGLWVCGWDIHLVFLPSGFSWHVWLNVKLSCNPFPRAYTSFQTNGSLLSALVVFITTLASWAASMGSTLFPYNIVDKATVLERTCSTTHREIMKSNCLIEHKNPLASPLPSWHKVSSAWTTTGNAAQKIFLKSISPTRPSYVAQNSQNFPQKLVLRNKKKYY